MAIDFRQSPITIPTGTGRRSINRTVVFNSKVNRATVVLNGFKLAYATGDRPVSTVEADTDILSIDGNAVTFRVQCNYGDKNFDDPFNGYVTATIIADVA